MACIHRRAFLAGSAAWLAGAASAYAFWPSKAKGAGEDIRGRIARGDAPSTPGPYAREAYAYRKLASRQVACKVCPHGCVLAPGDRSVCRSKVNIEGTLYTLA